jgi:hypothetical protein
MGGVLVTAVRTENVNWDEFALLQRTATFLRTGTLQGGGRPGLAELVLAAFVHGCQDTMVTVWRARTMWVGVTLAYLGGLWALLRHLPFRRERSGTTEALALALLTCVPVFPRWGLQIRTDQPALAFAIWSATLLVAGRRRVAAVAGAGLLLGIGFLFSQKAAYVGALGVLLFALAWLGEEGAAGRRRWAGGAVRMCVFAAGAMFALGLYRFVLARWVALPPALTVSRGLSTFAFYRKYFGFASYRAMLPTLLPHALLLLGLVLATARRWGAVEDRRALLAAWAILALGAVVGLFHAAALPYFWLTLGLFPAIALAIALVPIVSAPFDRVRTGAVAAIAAALACQGIVSAAGVLRDTQWQQREAFAFVQRSFGRDVRAFHPEGALFCSTDPSPFPVYFTENIVNRFGGPDGTAHADWFEKQFRERPVTCLIPSHVYQEFPLVVQRFWRDHYQPYSYGVQVAGALVQGPAGATLNADLLVSGDYRWRGIRSGASKEPPRVVVAGRTLVPGDRIPLTAGVHTVRLLDNVEVGALQLSLDEAPEAPDTWFYSREAIGQMSGRLTW